MGSRARQCAATQAPGSGGPCTTRVTSPTARFSFASPDSRSTAMRSLPRPSRPAPRRWCASTTREWTRRRSSFRRCGAPWRSWRRAGTDTPRASCAWSASRAPTARRPPPTSSPGCSPGSRTAVRPPRDRRQSHWRGRAAGQAHHCRVPRPAAHVQGHGGGWGQGVRVRGQLARPRPGPRRRHRVRRRHLQQPDADHLDFHKDLEDYFGAKRRLFLPDEGRNGTAVAVVNAGDEFGARLAAECRPHYGDDLWTCAVSEDGASGADVVARGLDSARRRLGLHARLPAPGAGRARDPAARGALQRRERRGGRDGRAGPRAARRGRAAAASPSPRASPAASRPCAPGSRSR